MAYTALRSGPTPTPGAIRLLDEAFHLLRSDPGALALYMAGSMPFWLALLYFWNDMSRSAFASQRCLEESLLLALLFVLMKAFQSRFMTRLSDRISSGPEHGWGWRRWLNVVTQQTIIQSSSVVVLPVAALMVLPLPWAVAFYQNALRFGNGERSSLREVVHLSWDQARLWPRLNHAAVYTMGAFGVVVFFQLLIALVFAPELLRLFTGIETVFTRGGWRMLNTTLFATTLALSYLVVDPLVKAFYVLRCFYGESLESGADLRVELQRLSMHGRGRHGMLAVLLLAATGLGARAETPPPPMAAREIARAVARTIDDPRYAWRMPREKLEQPEQRRGPVGTFLAGVKDRMTDAFNWCWDRLERFRRWVRDRFPREARVEPPRAAADDRPWLPPLLLIGSFILLLGLIVLAAFRLWGERRRETKRTVKAEAVPVTDPADAGVSAADLHTEDWLRLARDLTAQGKFRLALRSAYLSALSLLADHRLLTIAKHKSNIDYRRELARRAHQLPAVIECFESSAVLFDRVWYGTAAASRETVDTFLSRLSRMRSDLET